MDKQQKPSSFLSSYTTCQGKEKKNLCLALPFSFRRVMAWKHARREQLRRRRRRRKVVGEGNGKEKKEWEITNLQIVFCLGRRRPSLVDTSSCQEPFYFLWLESTTVRDEVLNTSVEMIKKLENPAVRKQRLIRWAAAFPMCQIAVGNWGIWSGSFSAPALASSSVSRWAIFSKLVWRIAFKRSLKTSHKMFSKAFFSWNYFC